MDEVYMLAGMALVTFGIRYSMFALAGRYEFPRPLLEALQYVPPAVLTAIIVPSVLIPTGEKVDLSLSNAYLVGAVVAASIGWWRKNLLLTIVVGMAAFLIWQGVMG
ncbi:MAG TPA: AzlD domain-containing protein [Anaerolineae bacterium]|nr:AzlD domain-containing protein [Anaerolineae bacterium]HMR64817.1 AzlD domain-containing protein [Anaerolineae bacterium]